jgi:hypothetical protein
MPRKSNLVELEAEAPVSNGHVTGWRPAVTTRRAVADPERFPRMAPPDGVEPFWAEIRDDLSFAEIERIPYGIGNKYSDLWDAMAPYVTAWNATALNPETNQWEPVPAPADAGPDVFKTQNLYVTDFIALCLKFSTDLNLPKGRKRSGDTGAG